MDMRGFNSSMWNKQTIRMVQKAAKIAQDYYPEHMGKFVLCNAPFIFTGIWALVKGWLDERTRKKISIQGSGYLTYLRQYVDDDQIPDFLGGSNPAQLEEDMGPW